MGHTRRYGCKKEPGYPEQLKIICKNYCQQKPFNEKKGSTLQQMEEIPYKLIGELMEKMSVKEWIEMYEKNWVPKSKKK